MRWSLLLGILVLWLASAAAHAERVVLQTNFAANPQSILPEGWKVGIGPDPAPKALLESVDDESRKAVRMIRQGEQYQLYTELPEMPEGWYRLSLVGRTRTRSPITVGIRPVNAQHRYVWQSPLELTEVWEARTIDIHLNRKLSAKQAFSFELARDGEMELAEVKLTEMSRPELIEAMKAAEQHLAPGRKNLARHSRFGLGMQSGWAVGRDLSDELYEVAADASVVGPSGVAALKVAKKPGRPGVPVQLFMGVAHLPRSDIKHVASLWIKGQGGAAISIYSDRRFLTAKAIGLTDAWQRVELPFEPVFMGRVHQVVLAVDTAAWVDGLQVEPGEKASEYDPGCEVALSWPEGEAAAARMQIADESTTARWQVSSAPKGAFILARTIDAWGAQSEPQRFGPIDQPQASGEFPAINRLGSFRIEAWVEDPSGHRISPYNEIVITRVVRPRHWKQDAPDSPFGIHMGSTHRQLVLAKAAGINWTRLHDAGGEYIQWFALEPEKGQWHWRDDELKRYRDHHIKIMGSLSTSPGWASSYQQPVNDYYSRWVQPNDNAEFANYCAQVVGRYKGGVIDHWDIWNEPWLRFWSKWDPAKKDYYRSATPGKDYAELSKAAYEMARKTNPDAVVAGVNTTAGGRGGPWTEDVVKHDGDLFCDIYGYHHYANDSMGFPGDGGEKNFASALAPIKQTRGGISKGVWMTEGNGTNTLIDRGMYHHSAPGLQQEDVIAVCDRMARYAVSLLSCGVQKIFLYHTNMNGEMRPGFDSFQTLVIDDGYPHPCAASHAQFAWEVEGARFAKRLEIGQGVYAYLFEADKRAVAVVTSAPSYRPLPLPGKLTIKDLFGNVLPEGTTFDGRIMYVEAGSAAELEQQLPKR